MNQADLSPSQSSSPAPGWATRGPVALVYSPHAGSARGDHPQALLERAGVAVALSVSVDALDASAPLGQRWRAAGCVAAIAAGGDGTVGAVATHAVGADLPLGIVPLGTANDIARALNIPLIPADAARVIAQGALQAIDAGQAIPSQTTPRAAARHTAPSEAQLDAALAGAATSQPAGERADEPAAGGAYFLHALTLGLNVEFARLATDATRRRLWGRFTYIASAIESLDRLKPIPVTLHFSGMSGAPEQSVFVVQCETALFTAINLPVFGGRLGLRVPGIRSDDRLLDFIIVEAPEPQSARVAFETALGAMTRAAQTLWAPRGGMATASESLRLHPVQNPAGVALPGARWFRARAVEIETEQPVELTLDGELRGRTPAVARVAPGAVRVIVPASALVAR
jgi:diacylglycerol kinase (ATP)